jgi:hypothetical protein
VPGFVLAVLIGMAYYGLTLKDIPAVKDRLGAFTLSCAFLALTSISALPVSARGDHSWGVEVAWLW